MNHRGKVPITCFHSLQTGKHRKRKGFEIGPETAKWSFPFPSNRNAETKPAPTTRKSGIKGSIPFKRESLSKVKRFVWAFERNLFPFPSNGNAYLQQQTHDARTQPIQLCVSIPFKRERRDKAFAVRDFRVPDSVSIPFKPERGDKGRYQRMCQPNEF